MVSKDRRSVARRRPNRRASVRKSERALREFAGRLITAQEFERARIARELHDDFGQRINFLALEFNSLRESIPAAQVELREKLERLQDSVQTIARDMQAMAQQLHPAKLSRGGLVTALRGLASDVRQRYPIDVQFYQEGSDTALPSELRLCLFRVAQESLNNVVKHSGATHASVSIEITDEAVRLCIVDNGRGFERSRANDGLGLISMTERVETAGGQLTIRPQLSRGTKVHAVIRLPRCCNQPMTSDSTQGSVQQ